MIKKIEYYTALKIWNIYSELIHIYDFYPHKTYINEKKNTLKFMCVNF